MSPQISSMEKPWWQSKTIIGIAVMALSQILRAAKIDIIDAELTDLLTLLLDTLGAGLAIYGRVNARHQLKLTKPGGPWNPNAEVRRAQKSGKRNSERGAVQWSLVWSLFGIALFWFGVTCLVIHWCNR